MGISTRLSPINRSINLVIDKMLSPEARSAIFAAGAQEILDGADQENRTILGRLPLSKTYVDGRQGAPIASVKPEGVILLKPARRLSWGRWRPWPISPFPTLA